MSKISFYALVLSAGLCSAYCGSDNSSSAGGASTSAPVTPTVAYTISQAYSEGVDDSGQMWIAIEGSFASSGNTVSVTCDGSVISAMVQSQSASQVVASFPAASFYNDCSFEVQAQGEVSTSFTSGITAISLSGASHEVINSNNSLVNIELDGDIETTPLVNSTLSVSVSCNAGASYAAASVISQTDTSVVVSIANPGKGKTDSCIFIVEDSFKDLENNAEVVSSPPLTALVSGM